MRYAILSDVHANLEALEATLKALSEKQVDHYVVLGDIINYGANPKEVLAKLTELTPDILMGNHELALFDPNLENYFNPIARDALAWTRTQLSEEEKAKIRAFPLTKELEQCLFVHACPLNPQEFYYIFTQNEAQNMFGSFNQPVCFIGHTHVPSLFTQGAKDAEALQPGVINLRKNRKQIVNVGSVGQSRDFDWRASCAVFDDQAFTVELLRVEYEWQVAMEKIRAAGLPHYLAERLEPRAT